MCVRSTRTKRSTTYSGAEVEEEAKLAAAMTELAEEEGCAVTELVGEEGAVGTELAWEEGSAATELARAPGCHRHERSSRGRTGHGVEDAQAEDARGTG